MFGCLRRRASLFHASGARTGRGLVAGFTALEASHPQVKALFTGDGHAPAPLSEAETQALFGPLRDADAEACYDLPSWLIPDFEASLGQDALSVAHKLRDRAPVFLRVNLSRLSRAEAVRLLREEGIVTEPHDSVATALRVTENPRRVAQSPLYMQGLIELQDASSQAACAGLPEAEEMLDYCAGGGGKVLAYGDRSAARLYAHDANSARLSDLAERAKRAKLSVKTLTTPECVAAGPFDLVLVDAPCSGSGTWRRAPEAKWALTRDGLNDLRAVQANILDAAATLVAEGGCLAYATCSVLEAENMQQVQSLLARSSDFKLTRHDTFLPSQNGDGFFVAHLTKRVTAS